MAKINLKAAFDKLAKIPGIKLLSVHYPGVDSRLWVDAEFILDHEDPAKDLPHKVYACTELVRPVDALARKVIKKRDELLKSVNLSKA